MKLLDSILGVILTYLLTFYGLPKAFLFMKKTALIKVDQGLSSSTRFTEKLTCKTLNSKMKAVNIQNCK